MTNFIKRIMTAVILIPLALTIISNGGIGFALFLWVIAVICSYEYLKISRNELFGIVYILAGIYSFYFLRKHEGFYAVLVVLVTTWSNDSFAYFFGKSFGANQIWPTISPQKTWEGFFAGSIGAILIPLIIQKYLPQIELNDIFYISFPSIVLVPMGDLIESKIKRFYNVKDSGNLLPGHGGIFDRIDSLLLIGPWACFYFHFLKIND